MFTPLPRNASRKRATVLLPASLILNLLPAQPVSAARRAPAQAAAAPFVRVLNLPVNDIAYDKQSKQLFASVPSRAGAGGNSVTEINPLTGALGPPAPGRSQISSRSRTMVRFSTSATTASTRRAAPAPSAASTSPRRPSGRTSRWARTRTSAARSGPTTSPSRPATRT
ncbi:MAG: hypothetical protein QOH51_3070 [Acidobacteriota bacterium]|jgi:hypothetical protein|nr:hypothetical protein [Acidobacteriota bacterium]